jgi:hypothetical protein
MRRKRLAVIIVLGSFAVATQGSSGCGSSTSSSSSTPSSAQGSSPSAQNSQNNSHNDPSKNASDSNTPSVGPTGSVEVDDLRWRLEHADRTRGIGNREQGLGANANGIFVVATLHVTNNKHDTATLTDAVVSLRAAGKDYKVSSDAQTALSVEGGVKPLVLEEVGPEVSTTVRAGFDVPPQVLHEHPQLRFKELGFGPTHAYITLP